MAKARAREASKKDEIESPVVKVKRSKSNQVDLQIPVISKQRSGNLLVCGQNDVGQLGLNPDDVSEKSRPALVNDIQNLVEIRAGGMHSLCLESNGSIWTFGCNDEGALGRDTTIEGSEAIPTKIDLPGKVVRISAGDSHSACLLDDGRAFAWGSFRDSHGSMGLTTDGNKKSPVELLPEFRFVEIASGSDHLVLLTKNGRVYTIGCAEQGQLGRVSSRTSTGESRRGKKSMLTPGTITKKAGQFVANAIWATPFCTFLRENSTEQIFGFGLNNYSQLAIQGNKKESVFNATRTSLTNINSLAGGQHHTLCLTNDNKCLVIGRKDYGRLGLGEVKEDLEELTPVGAMNDKKVVGICCGDSNSFAVCDDGKVYVWGLGTNSQLGVGDDEDVLEPKLIIGAQTKEKTILTVNSGGQHTLLIVEAIKKVEKTVTEPAKKENAVTEPEKKEKVVTELEKKEKVVIESKEIPVAPVKATKGKKKATETNSPKINGNGTSEKGSTDSIGAEQDLEAASEKSAPSSKGRARKRKN